MNKIPAKRMSIKFIATISLFITLFSSCVSTSIKHYQFNQKQSAEKLREDVVLLKKILEANHPSLYWHTPKDTIDFYFSKAINSIQDSLTEVQFRNVVAEPINKIKCGHTGVRFSANYSKLIEKNRNPSFPLFLKVWQDSMVVLSSLTPKDSIFKRGTIITSINQKKPQEILNKMYGFMTTDGYATNFNNQVISNNFTSWYKTICGLDSSYIIGYIDTTGKESFTTIKNFAPQPIKKDTGHKVAKPIIKPPVAVAKPPKPSKKEKRQLNLLSKRNLLIDSSISTAYIKLNTFSGGKLRKFFRKSFKKIKDDSIKNVVIDLRENGGGNVLTSTLLSKYIANKSFKLGDTVQAISRKFEYKKHIKKWGIYWLIMNTTAHKAKDGSIHFRRFEKHYYQPKTKNHFNGDVYIVQGGYTFSASTMFISNIKGQSNVTLVGEETGGGYYGNTAMHLPTIVLPNSKLRVILPMYRLVMDKNRPKGRGIMPDVFVQPSSVAIKKAIDLKMSTVRNMIIAKQKKS